MKSLFAAFIAVILLAPQVNAAEAKPVPRILAALYDSRWESTPRSSQIHRFFEMPANHLGYDIRYYDINGPLPVFGDDVAGVVIWFDLGIEVPNPKAYLAWLRDLELHGKKLLFIENSGVSDKSRNNPELLKQWNEVLSYIGLQDDNRWNQVTYGAKIMTMDKSMVEFERKIVPPLPTLVGIHTLQGGPATSHLRVSLTRAGDEEIFDLVTTSPAGGYVATGYAVFEQSNDYAAVSWSPDPFFQWYINPFNFIQKSMNLQALPVPDVTTLDGKRIFYSHIDGDGWNNVSELRAYESRSTISAEVIYDQILKPYNDFAFNVALITADVDPSCYAVDQSEPIARKIFALPNVEPSTHTYSHPLFWEFFENYSADLEKPFLDRYPPRPGQEFSLTQMIKKKIFGTQWEVTKHPDSKPEPKKKEDAPAYTKVVKRGSNEESAQEILQKYYDTPRSYACTPFNLEQEIIGSAKRVNELSPPNKKIRLLQWSGDTSPFEEALAMTRKAGLLNINGGDSRFDTEYPSYSAVAPIGLLVGKERQIYSSNSNEDTYTNLWRDRFFGYRYLQTTAKNTESPIRVSPFNIYFHIFSGEKQASLNAIKENFDFARTQNIIRMMASDYSQIAEGFFSTGITALGQNIWKIDNRGHLNTFRFDNADALTVDFAASKGVIGQQHFQTSLYVALDPAATDVVLAIKKDDAAPVPVAYLIDSTWQIDHVVDDEATHQVNFGVQGYGPAIMHWKMPAPGEYTVKVTSKQANAAPVLEKRVSVKGDGILTISIDGIKAIDPLNMSFQRL